MSIQREAPFRPRQRAEISQQYNDGVVQIYTEADDAVRGYMPVPRLTPTVKLAYQERKLGIKRYYDAKMNQIHVERVIRVPGGAGQINNQNVAETEDGTRYRIDLVQEIPDVYPPSLDLTLVLYTQGIVIQPPPPVSDNTGGTGETETQTEGGGEG